MSAFVPSAASLLPRAGATPGRDQGRDPVAPHAAAAPACAAALPAPAPPHPATAHAPAPAPAAAARPVTVVWFRDDLRVDDHPALHAAAARGDRIAALVLPAANDDEFRTACLTDLRARLRARGCELHARAPADGSAAAVAAVLLRFAADARARRIHFHRAVDKAAVAAERAVVAAARQHGVAVAAFWSGALRAPDRLPFAIADAPDDCDDFGRAVGALAVEEPLSAPSRLSGIRGLDSGSLHATPGTQRGAKGPEPQPGARAAGETGALARVRDYCAGHGLVAPPAGASGRTIDTKFARLGPFLAAGCVSPRRVWAEVAASVSERSVRRFCAELELVLRDFVLVTTLKRGGVCPA